ncbi:hypothetical protein SHELI_v1c07380 [Spiroplasma helicoides]|uniref:S1 motif domain-containing protein n=1 Tax=Spiroplasma helicoides TaxID=216938 RepID=A0A1B3SL97_9MOLU|nr:S1 RNA-binding domain-containing protein [Spiroplasma helicoides]AOG60687.1 hypothetical protein SHELI_v1c07380 [Spiroplasma helicoides]
MLEKGQKVKAKVTSIVNYGAFCEVVDNESVVKGLIHISEFSDYFVGDISQFVKVGEEIELEVIDFLSDKNQVKLSFKRIRPQLLKEKESKIKETGDGFDNLKNMIPNKD